MECILNINDKYKLYDNVTLLSSELPLDDYWQHVLDEVDKIKKYFTTEEIQRLIDAHLEDIDGQSQTSCIYGTMVGSCFDDRVHEFIFTLPVVVRSNDILDNNVIKRNDHRGHYFLTPLEHYIIPMDEEKLDDFEDDTYSLVYYQRVQKVLNLFK
jgi:hypothetical protein